MMFFIALMSFITAGAMLAVFSQAIYEDGMRDQVEDRIVDVFLCTGFVCILISAGHLMWELL